MVFNFGAAEETLTVRPPSPAPSGDTARTSHFRRNSFMAYTQGHANHFHLDALRLPEGAHATPWHLIKAFFNAILATAFFRCWHMILFYLAWGTMVTLVNKKVVDDDGSFTFQPTLLTVVGTVLGFVVSYRTTSSFERYNEGRRYWSQIILASRTLARAVWFHVPDLPPATPQDEGRTDEEWRARSLIEKKTVINLIEAFSVAVKHYLRGEEGIAYVDLYHLVKFLPSYAFPAGMVPPEHEQIANMARTQSYREAAESRENVHYTDEKTSRKEAMDATSVTAIGIESRMEEGRAGVVVEGDGEMGPSVSIEPASPPEPLSPVDGYSPAAPADGAHPQQHVTLDLPSLPATTTTTTQPQPQPQSHRRGLSIRSSFSRSQCSLSIGGQGQGQGQRGRSFSASSQRTAKPRKTGVRRAPTFVSTSDQSVTLLPASLPPKYGLFDIFPFSLFVKHLSDRGKQIEGKKAAKLRAKTVVVTRNVPLEISMYLTSYVATLGARKAIDVPTNNLLIASVNQLTDALTGLERILTTPIPFSYSIHLWLVTILYNFFLPFQIYPTLKWVTIPACGIVSFIFFGFLVAGEEIENPFGYDKNDLNMDHFTHNIIRNELRALTAFPPPSTDLWAFSPRNDRLFAISDPYLSSHPNIHAMKEDKSMHSELGGVGSNGAVQHGVNVATNVGVPGVMGTGLTPEEWVRRGTAAMRDALARAH